MKSLRRAAAFVRIEDGHTFLDTGCGSGLLLPLVSDRLKSGVRYVGLDILSAGLASLEEKACRLGVRESLGLLRADLSQPLPLADHSIQCAVAHFSVYTLSKATDRRQVWRELYRVIQPGGRLIAANPTADYNALEIIRGSLESLKRRASPGRFRLLKHLVYPLTLRLGLNHIQRQIHKGVWHGYNVEEFREEIESAGFSIEHTERVYSGSGILLMARRP